MFAEIFGVDTMTIADLTIQTRSGNIRVSDSGGGGFPLLMIHGSGTSRHVFDRQFASLLTERWRLVAVDLPGHGQSDDAIDPQAAYSITGLAGCIDDVIEQMKIARVALFGWSLGGHVAIEVASRNDRIAGMMVVGAPPVPPGLIGMLRGFHPSFDLLLASKQKFTPRDVDRFERLCFAGNGDPAFHDMIERADGRLRAVFSNSLMRGEGADQRKTVENASVPIAFVNGADDPIVRLNYFSGLDVPNLFDGTAHVIAGAGHAVFWDRPEIFNPLVNRFLVDVSASETARRQSERRAAHR